MANPTTAAGDNGVSGATEGVSGGDTALRNSVAITAKGGSAVLLLLSIAKLRTCALHTTKWNVIAPARDRT